MTSFFKRGSKHSWPLAGLIWLRPLLALPGSSAWHYAPAGFPTLPVGVLLRKDEDGVMGGVTGGVRLPLAWRGGVAVLLRDTPPPMDSDSLGVAFFFMVSCSRRAASVMNLIEGDKTGSDDGALLLIVTFLKNLFIFSFKHFDLKLPQNCIGSSSDIRQHFGAPKQVQRNSLHHRDQVIQFNSL